MDLPTGILISLIVFIFLTALLNKWRFHREEKTCLLVLSETTRTHGLITTEACAKRCDASVKSVRATLERLRFKKRVRGWSDEDQFWYWKILNQDKERLIRP